jgi:hypothetical protein
MLLLAEVSAENSINAFFKTFARMLEAETLQSHSEQ